MTITGKRIVVTRAAHQSAELADLLRARGAIPVAYPCIAILPPENAAPLTDALLSVTSGGFDWLILTSSNAADAVGAFLPSLSPQSSVLSTHFRIAVAGEATARRAQSWLGRTPDLVPTEFSAGGIADALAPHLTSGTRVLLPISEIARPELQDRLTTLGAVVTAVIAYRTGIGSGGEDVPALLRARHIDAITFTSPSTVANFLTRLNAEGGHRADLIGIPIGCIGATTAAAARDAGLTVTAIAPHQTMQSVVATLESFVQ